MAQKKPQWSVFVLFERGVGKGKVCVRCYELEPKSYHCWELPSSGSFLSRAITDYAIHTTISRIFGRKHLDNECFHTGKRINSPSWGPKKVSWRDCILCESCHQHLECENRGALWCWAETAFSLLVAFPNQLPSGGPKPQFLVSVWVGTPHIEHSLRVREPLLSLALPFKELGRCSSRPQCYWWGSLSPGTLRPYHSSSHLHTHPSLPFQLLRAEFKSNPSWHSLWGSFNTEGGSTDPL